MAISFVGSKTFTAAGVASGTFSVSLTDLKDTAGANATLAEDDLIIINYVVGSNADLAFSPPAGYTEDTELYANDIGDTNMCAWRKFMGATPDTTVDIPNSGSTSDGVAGTIFAFRGVDTTTPLDVAATTATGIDTGVSNPPSITPSSSGSWIVVLAASGARAGFGAVFTNPGDLSSTTNHFQSAVQAETNADAVAACGIKTDWASGAFDPSAMAGNTTNAGSSWAAITYALREAVTVQTLEPSLVTNSQTFYSPTVTATYSLTPSLFSNSQTFHAPTVSTTYDLSPSLVTNSQTFYSPSVSFLLSPPLLSNSQSFFSPTVTPGPVSLAPSLFTNSQSFFAPTIGLYLLAPFLTNESEIFGEIMVWAGSVSTDPSWSATSPTAGSWSATSPTDPSWSSTSPTAPTWTPTTPTTGSWS